MAAANGHPAGVDVDPAETREWVDAIDDVVTHDGGSRATELLERVNAEARSRGVEPARDLTTAYVNTIAPEHEAQMPGDSSIERKLRSTVRWNAIATVMRANRESSELGGHLASYQSAATLYEVGFNHFWHGPTDSDRGDLLFIQGHSSPGIYARAFLEGRIGALQLEKFRTETVEGGISSYPHPWLMPDFWQFPTVSMGLGPLMAIYQARFMKYLQGRELQEPPGRKIWAFMGDGEMDEPESLGAIALAGREKLDNLIFVVNCNLQRLDGPVRGNGKIIQELEMGFRGAGWNVIKVVWGEDWDPLLAADHDGLLKRRMDETVDGEYQTYKSRDGAFVRENFFGGMPGLKERVAHMSDDEIWALKRGGHDPQKVYAAYHAAVNHTGQPTVILAKTIKGYGMGRAGEARNTTHQAKKMDEDALLDFRDRFDLDLTDQQVKGLEFHKPADDAPEMRYLRERRVELGGSLPARNGQSPKLDVPDLAAFQTQLDGTGDREVSTTMAFVRLLSTLLRDKQVGRNVVPIVPDESRTFGMEGLFRQLGIFSQVGQLYQPEDSDQLMFYREDKAGQMLQEGINEPGAMSSWIAAATSYANYGVPMIPFYIYYSMFGFQRVADLAWAAGDQRARGFLLGATAGRTTLNGEGLQHQDGHSHMMSSLIPNCVSYDPTYAYEVATIIQSGLQRMMADQEDVYFYVTLMNENYAHPAMPEGSAEGILKGLHRIRTAGASTGRKSSKAAKTVADGAAIRLMGSGTILREVEAAADMLAADFGIEADVWSATSFTELRREAMESERWNRLHPGEEQRGSWLQECLAGSTAPIVAATDYVRSFPDQIRPWVTAPYTTLGTDGFGRSDYRVALRRFFEVDRHHVVLAALRALGDDKAALRAIKDYEIDVEVEAPWRR